MNMDDDDASSVLRHVGMVGGTPTFVTVSSSTSGGGNVNIMSQPSIITMTQNSSVTTPTTTTTTFSLTADSYEEVFKEITKKLYGEDQAFAEVIDAAGNVQQANLIFDPDMFRSDLGAGGSVAFLTTGTSSSTSVDGSIMTPSTTTTSTNLPQGTILLQRKICQDKEGRLWSVDGDSMTLLSEQGGVVDLNLEGEMEMETAGTIALPNASSSSASETETPERWFESQESLTWTTSKIARYNASKKVFRCVECDFLGTLSRVAEHWLGSHASLQVFQCPRCNYQSAWGRCVRAHLQKMHGEVTDTTMWKENPVMEEVTNYLTGLRAGVEARLLEGDGDLGISAEERRLNCPNCPYSTDRRDLFTRHESIHRDEKPFQCYVCDKQFNRADHVKKHFVRMHRDHTYDLNKIKKHFSPSKQTQGVITYSKMAKQQQQKPKREVEDAGIIVEPPTTTLMGTLSSHADTPEQIELQLDTSGTIPHIAYFNPPSTPGSTGPLQGIAGVGGTKKESKSKGVKKKKAGEKMYTCSYCPWQGVDNWCLKRHLNTHIKPFLCALCDYKAARSERLATHVQKVHNKRVCHKCSFLADDTEALSLHIQDSHQNPLVKSGFNCNVCQDYFELRADLEAHAILEHQKVIVQCDLCDFRTTDELSMEAHLREKHNLQPGMGAVAAAAAAAIQMQLPNQSHLELPDQLTLDSQGLLLHSTDSLGHGSMNDVVTDSLPSMGFQQDNGSILTKMETGLISADLNGGNIVNTQGEPVLQLQQQQPNNVPTAAEAMEVQMDETEPETLCGNCGIEFADEPSLKLHERLIHNINPSSTKRTVVVSAEQGSGETAPAMSFKSIVRNYVCSNCSYTASTKRLMMQHQRAHNGMELECKAEECQFCTPFDNTLKEHIHSDHASEAHTRCPHCGLKVPSVNAFTYHWRVHHPSLCGLCVNLYRVKYGMKENDLHDLVSKSMCQLVREDVSDKTNADRDPLGDSSSGSSSALTNLDDCLNNNDLDTSPSVFAPILTALSRRGERSSLQLIPNLIEYVVTPIFSAKQLRKLTKKGNRTRKRNSWARQYHSSSRRCISRTSTSWLLRRELDLTRMERNGGGRKKKKCYHVECMEHPNHRYFKGSSALVLHKLWHHSRNRVDCDTCSLKFPSLSQALIHKMREHNEEHVRDEALSNQQNDQELSAAATDFFHSFLNGSNDDVSLTSIPDEVDMKGPI